MSERVVSRFKVKKPKGIWLLEFTTHVSKKKHFGRSYILDTGERNYLVPCSSWEEAMQRIDNVLRNTGQKK